jgi:hypothetical protein
MDQFIVVWLVNQESTLVPRTPVQSVTRTTVDRREGNGCKGLPDTIEGHHHATEIPVNIRRIIMNPLDSY